MKLKVVLKMGSPFIYSGEVPLDGTFSFLIGAKEGFPLEKLDGTFDWFGYELPISRYGYLKRIGAYIKREKYKGGFFYRISVLFGKNAVKSSTKIFRKAPVLKGKFLESNLSEQDYLRIMSSGKMRSIVRPLQIYGAEEVWFYADVVEGREEEFAEIVMQSRETGIGKKTGHGYGQVKEVFVEEAEEYDGLFVEVEGGKIPSRPLPEEYETELPDRFYPVKLYSSLLPPYYLPVKTERMFFCYPLPLLGGEK